MKTVRDAVISQKGNSMPTQVDAIHFNGGFFFGVNNPTAFDFVCSRKQFNAEVDHLASNMGRATQSRAEYKKEFEYMTTPTIQPNPEFTQAMADKGELPSAGMGCMVFNGELSNPTYEQCVVDFVGRHVVVYSSESCTERTCNIVLVKFKPLTPPTKLEHGSPYEFELSFGDYRVGYYREDRSSFFDGIICGNKICGKTEATNIKPLTVG